MIAEDRLITGGNRGNLTVSGILNRGRHLVQVEDGHHLQANTHSEPLDQPQGLILDTERQDLNVMKLQTGVRALCNGEIGMIMVDGMALTGIGKLQCMKVFSENS